jgi:hypothetical protein
MGRIRDADPSLHYIPIHNLRLTELATVLQGNMERRFPTEPAARRCLPLLLPINGPASTFRAMNFNTPTTNDVSVLMLKSLVMMIREHGMRFRYFYQISRDSKRAEFIGYNPVWRGLEHPHGHVGDGDEHLRPVGERIKLEQFCDTARNIPEGTTCSVCMEDIEQGGKNENKSKIEGTKENATSVPTPAKSAFPPSNPNTFETTHTDKSVSFAEKVEDVDEIKNKDRNKEMEENGPVVTKCGHYSLRPVWTDGSMTQA